jgi:hypothetical protein
MQTSGTNTEDSRHERNLRSSVELDNPGTLCLIMVHVIFSTQHAAHWCGGWRTPIGWQMWSSEPFSSDCHCDSPRLQPCHTWHSRRTLHDRILSVKDDFDSASYSPLFSEYLGAPSPPREHTNYSRHTEPCDRSVDILRISRAEQL